MKTNIAVSVGCDIRQTGNSPENNGPKEWKQKQKQNKTKNPKQTENYQ